MSNRHYGWNAPDPFLMSSLNTTNIECIERGLVVMGCVVDVVRGYSAVLNGDFQKGAWGIPTLWVKGGSRIKSKFGK